MTMRPTGSDGAASEPAARPADGSPPGPRRDRHRADRASTTARRRSERGSATLETVVLWPAVFLLIFGIVHAGIWFHARNVALSAAREGARAAAVADGDGGAARAADFLAATTDGSILRVRDIRESGSSDTVTVTVTGSSTTLIPGWRVGLSQTATAPIRRWTSP